MKTFMQLKNIEKK